MTGFFMGKWASISYSEMGMVSPICCRAIVIGGAAKRVDKAGGLRLE
jgi:hypothetical protein